MFVDSFLQLAEHPRELCGAHADAASLPSAGRRLPAQQFHEVAAHQDKVCRQTRQDPGTKALQALQSLRLRLSFILVVLIVHSSGDLPIDECEYE